jgi:phenylacetate-coenzyme A ligase PaaK-like adenylate-forming protein
MPLIERVEGRDSDVFYIQTENGERWLQPTVFELALGRMLDAREFQIIQEKNTTFRIRVEPLPGKCFNHERGNRILREELKGYQLDGKLEVAIEVVERLSAEGDQKFKRIISKVDRDKKK